MKVRLGLLLAALACLLAACGSSEKTTTVVKTVQAPAAEPTETTTTETTEEVVEEEPESDDCDELGINPKEGNVGVCVEPEGQRVKVVNKDQTLHLKELDVRLDGIEPVEGSISSEYGEVHAPNGQFVIFNITVKNKLNSPAEFNSMQDQVGLLVGNKNYTESFDVENGGVESSCLWKDPSEIQPGNSKSCSIVFDIPPKAVADIGNSGNFQVINFSDAADFDDGNASIVGVIRTWQ